MAPRRVLVPVADSITLRRTVAYAVQSALEATDGPVELHLVAAITYVSDTPGIEEDLEDAEALLDDAAAWAREDAGDAAEGRFEVVTAVTGVDEYLFSPRDFSTRFSNYVEAHDVDLLVLDPEYDPGAGAPMVPPIESHLRSLGVPFEEASVEPATRRGQLVGQASLSRYVVLFGVSIVFYLLLGDPTYWFDWVTGAAVAGIVTITFSHVTFADPPTGRRSPVRTLRFVLYVPYLLWEIVKANVAVALVILRPSMPIEPQLVRFRARVGGGLPTLALANSITLTPGTLTVQANDQNLLVHCLITDARDDLIDGGLERGVRYVFYGREATQLSSPRDRDEYAIEAGAGTDDRGADEAGKGVEEP